MNRYLSALAPVARITVWKALAVAFGTAAIQAVFFITTLTNRAAGDIYTLETLIQKSNLSFTFTAGLLLLCGVLVLPALERGTRTAYMIRRLPVEEGRLTRLWGLQNTLLLLLYWAVQLTAVLLLSQYALTTLAPATVSHQSFLLACYRSPYLHGLLPLADWLVLLRNLSGCLALGLAAAAFCHHRRHGRTSLGILPLAVMSAIGFPVYAGTFLPSLCAAAVFLLLCFYYWKNVMGVHRDED